MGNHSESKIFIQLYCCSHDGYIDPMICSTMTAAVGPPTTGAMHPWSHLLPEEQKHQEGLVTSRFWQG